MHTKPPIDLKKITEDSPAEDILAGLQWIKEEMEQEEYQEYGDEVYNDKDALKRMSWEADFENTYQIPQKYPGSYPSQTDDSIEHKLNQDIELIFRVGRSPEYKEARADYKRRGERVPFLLDEMVDTPEKIARRKELQRRRQVERDIDLANEELLEHYITAREAGMDIQPDDENLYELEWVEQKQRYAAGERGTGRITPEQRGKPKLKIGRTCFSCKHRGKVTGSFVECKALQGDKLYSSLHCAKWCLTRDKLRLKKLESFTDIKDLDLHPLIRNYYYFKYNNLESFEPVPMDLGRCCQNCKHLGKKVSRSHFNCPNKLKRDVWKLATCKHFSLNRDDYKWLAGIERYARKSGVDTTKASWVKAPLLPHYRVVTWNATELNKLRTWYPHLRRSIAELEQTFSNYHDEREEYQEKLYDEAKDHIDHWTDDDQKWLESCQPENRDR